MPENGQNNGSLRWVLAMAWRDSRGQRRKLLLFTFCIVFGIGALVAIRSFRHNLEATIDVQARTLLGADLRLSTLSEYSDEMEEFIASLGGDTSREVRLRSMAFFPDKGQTRLVEIRAMDGVFPFYGEIETQPAKAEFRSSEKPLALVEDTLLVQFGIQPGDTVKLGEQEFKIAGGLLRIAGESEIRGIFAPRIYIDQRYLEQTHLIQRGSLTRYRVYFRFDGGLGEEREALIEKVEDTLLADNRVDADTVSDRKRRLGRTLNNLYNFFNLIGFVALLLGGLGVAGAVQVYLKDKLNTVAVLRCLGAPAWKAFAVYLIQIMAVGLLGSILGAILGISIQFLLPGILLSFLPFEVPIFISWHSVIISMLFGWVVTLLFAFIPLLSVRRITPLRALRASFENPHILRSDPAFWIVVGLIVILMLGFCFAQTSRFRYGAGFAGALFGSLIVLSSMAVFLRWALRRLFPKSWPYAWRLGLSNLYRPNNRTLFLVVTLGMGTFLIYTIYLTQGILLAQTEFHHGEDRPNAIFFDIQPDQIEGMEKIVKDSGSPLIETVPIVTMRIAEINGRTPSEIRSDPESHTDGWTLRWEYRSTFRSKLTETEEIVEGTFTPTTDGTEPIPISIELSIMDDLDVKLGDEIVFDVQGIPIATRIDSVRKVDWARLKPNFYMVFPTGILEEAPAFYALATRTPDRQAMATLQHKVVQTYPNISAIDLSLVLDTLTSILDKMAFVIRFMASFTVATGLMVLAGAIVTSRYQRIQESVLLCTLGASGGFIRRIMSVEYILLGAMAGLTGALLAVGATWALAHFMFEIPFHINWSAFPVTVLAMCGLTLITGLLNSRGIANHPPLAVLRSEG